MSRRWRMDTGTSTIMRMLEEEETITQTTNQPEESFYDEKGKQLKASLIKLAKASHHKTFMEICLREKKPPRNMRLWVEPHIYHSTKGVEREWRDTLITASLKLLATLIKHYNNCIIKEKETITMIITETSNKLKQTTDTPTREAHITKWKKLREYAEIEAKTVSENLKEQREKKMNFRNKKRRRETQDEEKLMPDPKKHIMETLKDMLKDYNEQNEQPPKNGNAPHEGGRNFSARGKGPANGRSYVKKTWPPKKP